MKWLFIGKVVPYAVIIPLGMALWNRRFTPGAMKVITGYLLLGGIINIIAAWLAARRLNNLPLLHIYTAVEFIVLSFFYKKILTGKMITGIINGLLLLFPVFCITNAVFFQSIYTYNTYARSLGAFILILYALFYCNQLLEQPASGTLINKPFFWINAGVLIYFSGSLLLFLFAAFLTANRFMDIWAWRIHALLVLFMYVLFTIGFYKCRK